MVRGSCDASFAHGNNLAPVSFSSHRLPPHRAIGDGAESLLPPSRERRDGADFRHTRRETNALLSSRDSVEWEWEWEMKRKREGSVLARTRSRYL